MTFLAERLCFTDVMFVPVWRTFVLVIIVTRCVIVTTSHEQQHSYLPAITKKNIRLLPITPRLSQSPAHKRFKSAKLYLTVLLLLLSCDVEVNPGPSFDTMPMKTNSLHVDDEPSSVVENFVLNRSKALKKKEENLNLSDYTVVTIKLKPCTS